MQMLREIDSETLKQMSKCASQFSTALRTFSKVMLSLSKLGTKSPEKIDTGDVLSRDPQPEIPKPDVSQPEISKLIEFAFTRECVWGKTFSRGVATFVTQNLRADRLKNVWKLKGSDKTNRKHWKKVPFSAITSEYQLYVKKLGILTGVIENEKAHRTARFCNLKLQKQERVFPTEPITMKEFRQVLLHNHQELTPLRG